MPTSLEKIPVLLVDDQPANLTALAALLDGFEYGLDLIKVTSGNDALRETLKHDFAVVLLDVQMPDMNGYETAELMRANPKTKHLPIMFVTAGMNATHQVFKGYEIGAVDYLVKPLEPMLLRSKVRVFCDLYRQRQTIEKHSRYLDSLVAERTAELVESREGYRQLAEKLELAARAANLGVWDWNLVSNELVWDARMYELYGVTREQFPNAYDAWVAGVHPDDRARRETAIEMALRNEQLYDIEFRVCWPDGTVRHIKSDGKVVFDEQGKPLRITGVNSDITGRKRAEEEIRQHRDHLLELVDERTASLNAIVEHAADGIITIDQNGVILSFNAAAERIFGYASNDVIGHNVNMLMPSPYRAEHDGYLQRYRETGEAHIIGIGRELVGQRSDGSSFPLYLAVSQIQVNGQLRFTGILRDISEQKSLEASLIQAREVAEVANRSKSDFLANMSHEIRTPMNAIIGMTRLTLQTELTGKQRNYLEKVDGAAQGLLGIIDDILDFSKIEAGKLIFEEISFSLADVLDNLSSLFVLKAQEKGLELLFDIRPDIPLALVGDQLRLQQVLMNLLSNAIKFTEQGEVIVRIASAGRDADGVVLQFEIQDTGIGISQEQSEKLFSAFVQADSSTTRNYGGSGLGLTISKRLAEMMHGRLWMESEVGVGSTFAFTARFGVQSVPQQPTLALDQDLQNMKVLVVDDNGAARHIMTAILQSLRLEVASVCSAPDAFAELTAAHKIGQPYHIVFMDWDMPSIDGLEAVRRIRDNPDFAKTLAIIMVTAYSKNELLEQAAGLQLEGLLEKPVSPSTVLDAIANACGRPLPSSAKRQRGHISYEDARKQFGGAHVLLVEDNLINQELARDILISGGMHVDLAANGAEAMMQVAKMDYDLVLMDCQMPVMDGFEASRLIRQDARFARLPILAMTANVMSGDKERCLAAGMNDHIAKPIDVDNLFTVLARWIKPRVAESSVLAESVKATAVRVVPQLTGVGSERALARLNGNTDQYLSLLAMFHQRQADAVERIQDAWGKGERDSAQRTAHILKSLAENVGADALCAAAGKLEMTIRQGDETGYAELVGQVAMHLQSLIQALGQYFTDAGDMQQVKGE